MEAIWTEELSRAKQKRADPADLVAREQAIRQLRRGDRLTVAHLVVLAVSVPDFMDAMAAIAKRGAVLFDLETNKEYHWSPEGASFIAAIAWFEKERRRLQTAPARGKAAETRARLGVQLGRLPKLSKTQRDLAEDEWRHGSLSGRLIAEKYGVTTRTLYNVFGARTEAKPRRRRRMNARPI